MFSSISISPSCFSTMVKRKCVYVDGNGRERGSVMNIFFQFSTSFNMFFLKRDKKGGVHVGMVMGKN